jgi:hypothetical protein
MRYSHDMPEEIVSQNLDENKRFARLIIDALRGVSEDFGLPESEVRNVLYRMVQAGRLQERRAPDARAELAHALEPSLVDLDPVTNATVDQARRLANLRTSLLGQGAIPTSAIATARGTTASTTRTWISRQRKAYRLFTVSHQGETMVPAFLLDEAFEPRDESRPAIEALRNAGEDGWALWAWFATPSAWLGGRVPVAVLLTDPERVGEIARRRAAAAM